MNAEPKPNANPPDRSNWRGNLILFGVTLLIFVALWAIPSSAAWNHDRALWIGLFTNWQFGRR
jgi:hypothetical protein